MFEIARMFGGWPHEVAAFPLHYFLRLRAYYLETRKEPKDPGVIEWEDVASGQVEFNPNAESIKGEYM